VQNQQPNWHPYPTSNGRSVVRYLGGTYTRALVYLTSGLALVVLLGQREREKLADPCQPRLTGNDAAAFQKLSMELFWNTHYEDFCDARRGAEDFLLRRYKIAVYDGHPEWFRLWDATNEISGTYATDDLDSAKLEKAWKELGKPEQIEDFVTAYLAKMSEFEGADS
jgi:hypothetical protein